MMPDDLDTAQGLATDSALVFKLRSRLSRVPSRCRTSNTYTPVWLVILEIFIGLAARIIESAGEGLRLILRPVPIIQPKHCESQHTKR